MKWIIDSITFMHQFIAECLIALWFMNEVLQPLEHISTALIWSDLMILMYRNFFGSLCKRYVCLMYIFCGYIYICIHFDTHLLKSNPINCWRKHNKYERDALRVSTKFFLFSLVLYKIDWTWPNGVVSMFLIKKFPSPIEPFRRSFSHKYFEILTTTTRFPYYLTNFLLLNLKPHTG